MKINRRWLWIGAAAAAAAGAFALGVPLGTLLIVGALLACPVMMSLGARGTAHGSGPQQNTGGMACHPLGGQDQSAQKPSSAGASTEPATTEVALRS